jgi:hypothetical protein
MQEGRKVPDLTFATERCATKPNDAPSSSQSQIMRVLDQP